MPGMGQKNASFFVITSHDGVAIDARCADVRKMRGIIQSGVTVCSGRNGLLETFEVFTIDEKL
jgi:hypothetical protein